MSNGSIAKRRLPIEDQKTGLCQTLENERTKTVWICGFVLYIHICYTFFDEGKALVVLLIQRQY